MIPMISNLTLPDEYAEYYNQAWRLVYVSEEDKEGRPTERPLVLDDLRLFFWAVHDGNGNVSAGSDIAEYTVRSNGGTVTIEGTVPYPADDYDMITAGYVDGIEALIQTMFIILSTERYKFPIYSFDFGVELVDLFGKPIPFAMAELPRRVTEALTQDNRIYGCTDFYFEPNRTTLFMRFTVKTIYGNVGAEMRVVL